MISNSTNVANDPIDFFTDYKNIYLPYFILNFVGITTGILGRLFL
jgi:hypothetical protein